MKIYYEVYTTVGNVRKINQDNYCLNGYIKKTEDDESGMIGNSENDDQIFAVCDGMGGTDSGAIAAAIAVQLLSKSCLKQEIFEWGKYIEHANRSICEYQKEHRIQMGTTIAGLSVHSSKVIAVNVGDSRIYQIRGNEIRQISRDHNEYQTMVEARIKVDNQTMRMARCRLTQFLGVPDDRFHITPHTVVENREEGDIYLLCSDGLYGVLSEEQILDIIYHNTISGHACKELVVTAKHQGSRDNITAMLVYINENKKNRHRIRNFWGNIGKDRRSR